MNPSVEVCLPHPRAKRLPRLIGTSIEDVFQLLGRAKRPLTAAELHASLLRRGHDVTCTTVYRALQVLRQRGMVRLVVMSSRRTRTSRIQAILAHPGRRLDDRGAMRFAITEAKRSEAQFAAQLERASAMLPVSSAHTLRRAYYRLVFRTDASS